MRRADASARYRLTRRGKVTMGVLWVTGAWVINLALPFFWWR